MKKNIAVVLGGYSSEFEVSIKSGMQVAEALERCERWSVYPIVISRDKWYLQKDEKIEINKNEFSLNIGQEIIRFDCVFNMIHGNPGENGKLQGYFEMLNIPYTSPDVVSSALTFNKAMSKKYLTGLNIPMAKSVWLRLGDSIKEDEILEVVGLPCFVKPNQGGSSFGISKVKRKEELSEALVKAFKEDEQIIVEQFIKGTEVTCGVLKTKKKEYILPLCEIVSENDFFDYESKYTEGKAQEIVPARVNDEIENKIKNKSSRIYDTFGCRGVVRVDFIVKGNQPYFLEINTVPGMSEGSILPKMLKEEGIKVEDFLSMIIEDVIEKAKYKEYR